MIQVRRPSFPAFYDTRGAVTRVNPEQVLRLAEYGPWLARVAPDGTVVCDTCLSAERIVAPMSTRLLLRDGHEVVVLGHLDLVAEALNRGVDHTPDVLLTARRQAVAIGSACLRNHPTASHNDPVGSSGPRLSLKPQRVADDDLHFLADWVAADRAAAAQSASQEARRPPRRPGTHPTCQRASQPGSAPREQARRG